MKDEHIWLLLFGRGWVAIEAIEGRHEPVFSRLCKARKLEVDKNIECVRLKEEE
jgi:hypothetical protein